VCVKQTPNPSVPKKQKKVRVIKSKQVAGKGALKIAILDFIKRVYGPTRLDTSEQPLFCGFPEDPLVKKNKGWPAKTMVDYQLPHEIAKSNNNYFSIATFRPDSQGSYRALKNNVVANYSILLDDIGTKVKTRIKLPLSWKIETSPGNYQGGLILDKPCTDTKLYESVVKALGAQGFSDRGAGGTARWARLPSGLNTKDMYLADGVAPKVKLTYFYPERRYSIEHIIKSFRLNLGRKAVNSDNIKLVKEKGNSSILSDLKSAGLWKSELEQGTHDITCPWVSQHTEQIDHGTVYFEPSLDNKHAGGFKCQHGHCSTRDINELKSYLGLKVEGKNRSQLEIALELVSDLPVFHDENRDAFCFLENSCLLIKDREVKSYLSNLIYKSTGKTLNQSNLKEVLVTLEGKARHEGKMLKLHNRIAFFNNRIYYDLCNGRAIKIKPNSWKIVEAPKLFRRYGHQQDQVNPLKGGDPWRLFKFLNISKKHQLETLVLLIAYLIPDIAHPIFHPHGPEGSAKSTLFKLIKRLIDPSGLEVMITPKDKRELVRQINRHHMPLFDNMSKIDSETSDILCMACTGGGIPKRELYSDDEDYIYNFKRCIGINGINLLITKPDLLDRTMLLHLDRISPDKRREETMILREFDEAKPGILGGMFDVLATAMSLHPEVNLTELPRLADFARWGYAIAEALKKGNGRKFIAAYHANIRRQNAEVLHNNSLCLAVTIFMKSRKYWEGTVKTAFDELFKIVEPSKGDSTFPPDPKNMGKHLERIQTTLAESAQITYRYSDKAKNDGFHIEFFKKMTDF